MHLERSNTHLRRELALLRPGFHGPDVPWSPRIVASATTTCLHSRPSASPTSAEVAQTLVSPGAPAGGAMTNPMDAREVAAGAMGAAFADSASGSGIVTKDTSTHVLPVPLPSRPYEPKSVRRMREAEYVFMTMSMTMSIVMSMTMSMTMSMREAEYVSMT